MKKFLNDIIGQVWTVFGLGVAWICLEGTARDVVGWGIIVTSVFWVATFGLRKEE